jgi:PBP1b-binding outer membrane lipoprotein LpoB
MRKIRLSLIGLVLALAVLGAGCSSQPSAVSVAQKQVRMWSAVEKADLKAADAACPGAIISCFIHSPAARKLVAAEQRLTKAQSSLNEAEGHPTTTTRPGETVASFNTPCTSCKTVHQGVSYPPSS